MFRQLFWPTAAIVSTLSLAAPCAQARPQLATPSIGWIDVSDITCVPTSDHTCVVKDSPFTYQFTYADPSSDQKKYRVRSGTELDVLDDRGNELFYHADEAKGRAKVAIIIPSDWDQRPGHEGRQRPEKPCHLKTSSGAIEGSMSSGTPIVSLACKR